MALYQKTEWNAERETTANLEAFSALTSLAALHIFIYHNEPWREEGLHTAKVCIADCLTGEM